MKTQTIKNTALFLVFTGMMAFNVHAQFQQITWGTAKSISGDSDVVNNGANGTMVGTYSPYLILNPAVSSVTINGITFQSNSLNAVISGMTNSTDMGTNANLTDTNYAALLTSASDTPFNTSGTGYIMFSNLILGATYQIQIWAENVNEPTYDQWENFFESSYGSSQGSGLTTSGAVNYDNNGNESGNGIGEYVTGTFTATNSVVQIHFQEWSEVWGSGTVNGNNGQGQINLLQVQELLLAPTITQQPQGIYYAGSGSNVTIAAAAAGTPPLSYQWYETNLIAMTGYAIAGQTNASLVVSNVAANDNYYLVITNNYGATNSSIASVDVYTSPVITAQMPVTYTNLFTLYAGANPTFSVTALGVGTVGYEWFTNGVLDGGALTNSLQMANVQMGSFSNYCIVTNLDGAATTAVWTVSVIADPTNATGGLATYPQQVMALEPVGYWRLNDINLDGPDNGDGDNGYVCEDYVGGNDGLYYNVTLGNGGYNPVSDPSDSSPLFGADPYNSSDAGDQDVNAIEGINFGSPAGTSKAFTVEAWVSGYAPSASAGIVTLGWGGGGEQFNIDCGAPTNAFRFFIRDAAGATHLVNSPVLASTTAGVGPWYHLVGVVDEINSQSVSFYINGQLAGTAAAAAGSGILASAYPMSIGARMGANGTTVVDGVVETNNDQFQGLINDVAVFSYALTPGEVASEYAAGGTNVAPFFVPTPANSAIVISNSMLVLPAMAYGNGPLWYQWINTNTSAILATGTASGYILNASYTNNSTPGSWNNQTLRLVVTNEFGAITNFVALTVLTNVPQFTLNLPANVIVAPGQPYTYSATALGALGYQWYSNGMALSGQVNSTYSPATTSLGTNMYDIVATNFVGATTSVISTLIVLAPPTNAYAAAILSLNPVAYWPMHEVEPAAQGDIETNYGTLGALATGYYPDWEYNSGQFSKLFMGPLAGGFDNSVFFTDHNSQATSTTNELYVPRNSPLSTLYPPFTVECWVYETNNTYQGDILSQNLFEGLNAGSANIGNGNDEGWRLNLGTSGSGASLIQGIQVYSYYNGNTLNNPIGIVAITTNQWYHVVLTCSASTNLILYTNGVPVVTNSAVGKLGVDIWAPFVVASGRGDSRCFSLGAISEVAAYTNALSALDISNHYAAGINPSPSPTYYQLVGNDNPLIWLRMNSPVYSVPALSTWPPLLNYGSAAVAGVYTPGTMPGMGAGPVRTNGNPVNGLSGTNVALLSGVSSFADAGYAAVYNPVGPTAFSVTAMFRGNPIPALIETIVGHGTNSWTISLSPTNGVLQCTLGGIGTLNATGNYDDGNWHQVVAEYAPGATPSSPGSAYIYIDGAINTSLAGLLPTTGIEPGTSSDVMIGADPEFTNNPSGVGRQFGGQVCEVALFTNALTAAQVTALYAAAGGGGPSISSILPLTATNAAGSGTSVKISVSATSGSASALAYQWYFNTASNYNGTALANNVINYTNVTTATLTITNLLFADGGWYYAIVTNLYGSATSALASLTVTANPRPTNIVFSVANNILTMTWPMDHTGWQMQAQTNTISTGLSNAWVNYNPSTGTNRIVIPINLTNGTVFYRLIYP